MPDRMLHGRTSQTASLWAMAVVAALGSLPCTAVAEVGVLVLRNGNVLQGDVVREGDQFRIDLPDARLQVPVAQVERHCRSLGEAYEQRRASRVGQSADAHLELARWCLRNGMLEHASREVLDARTIDPGHPALAGIAEQLGHLLKARAAARSSEKQIAAAPAPDQPAADSPAAVSDASEVEVSDAARAQFVRSIQPMLIHSCSTGGCHQVGSRHTLQLDRWALEGAGNAEIVRRNLAGVASQIDKEDPASSPLIQWARQAHGGGAATKPSTPLAPFQAALLLEWLQAASGAPPAPIEATPAGAVAPDFRQPIPPSSIPGVDAALAAELDASFEEAVGESAVAPPVADKPFAPRDDFDPEIFNRRFGPRAVQAKRQRAAALKAAAKANESPMAPATDSPKG